MPHMYLAFCSERGLGHDDLATYDTCDVEAHRSASARVMGHPHSSQLTNLSGLQWRDRLDGVAVPLRRSRFDLTKD